ncbi:tetratricopeptide repeat protein [uncultured Tenacibaculum sp.]|uniref:tetratricopeptide repeat protein n=1 Tax=uncultured Tenacibaculum sp. TaxID=174713 RepID=UPI0026239BBA|nr:tetratricopeptide repeat protein [uncultured Tenacibaculum sp.]
MKNKILIVLLLIGFTKVEAQTSTFKSIDYLVNKGRYKKALEELNNMPSSFASYAKKAHIYEAIDNYKLASKYYEKALDIKNDYAVKVKLGKSYNKEKKLKKAISIFEEIVENDDENLLIKYQLGKLYLKTKQPLKAKNTFKRLIEKDKKNANYHYQQGVMYAMLKKRNLKINSLLEAYKNDNEHIKAIHQLAVAYILLRDRDSSTIFMNRGLEVNPNHIELNKLKINSLYRKKDYLSAISLLEKIDTLKPNEHYIQKMLGRALYKLKDYEEAEKYFKKALKIDRSDFKSYTYLGDINFDQKEYKSAMFNYMIATYVGKESRDIEYYQLARVYKELGKPKAEMNAYKNSYSENGRNFRSLYQLANTTEHYYEDKKIAFKHYKNYIDKFEEKDSLLTSQVKTRIKEIKKYYFMKGDVLE